MPPSRPSFHGPLAALLTPRDAEGRVDLEGIERNVEFVLARGVTGLVVGGGTGEYFDLSIDQRKGILEHVSAISRGRVPLIAGVGAARTRDSLDLAGHAFTVGAAAALLPPPHFFRYGQEEIEAFYREAARGIEGPVLIYNLSGFLSPVEPRTLLRLVESVPNIIGVKDSSGSTATLAALAARDDLNAARILGNDSVLVEAIEGALLDAVISGPAGVVPEALTALFAAAEAGEAEDFERSSARFNELIERLDAFPYPWALKWAAEERGLFRAELGFKPSAPTERRAGEFREWLREWLRGLP